MKDHLILLAKITVTALLLYFLYSKIDWPTFGRILHQADFFLIVAALGLQFLSYFLGVDRWRIILENFKISVPFRKLARITFIGAFFSLFLPSMVGGDFFRAYYLARDQKQRLTTTLTSLILDRSAGFLALLAIGTAFAAVRSVSIQGVRVFPSVAGLTGVFLVANMVMFSHSAQRWLDGVLRRRGFNAAVERLDSVAIGLKALSRNPWALAKTLLLSFAVQGIAILIIWTISVALRNNVPFIYFLIFVPVINIIMMIPLTINGIGLREGAFYLLFSQVGMSREACISLGLVYYLVVVLSGLPGGILYSLYKKQDHLGESLHKPEGA